MITENYRIVTPAYGRKYRKAAEAIEGFTKGQDWVLEPDGCYVSIRDFADRVKVELNYERGQVITTVDREPF